ncbi:hypothetical protein EDD21DRAFT_320085 [Dissophora ornata]|nr:hypothetical protein EDD21DRAFT_320085 [Dissophora ornata]
MGNVSSADHDKVSELLIRRAKKKINDNKKRGAANGNHHGSSSSGLQSSPPTGAPPKMQRQKSSSRVQQIPQPLEQAEFYGAALGKSPSNKTRTADFSPHSPSSPSFSIPSTATTPTSAGYMSDLPYSDTISTSPTSPQRPPHPNLSPSQYHSSPIAISQHRYSHASTTSIDESQFLKSPASAVYVPMRRGSEHHLHHLQSTPESHLLGTSPEAKDWLKQKPTRSSSHMIHQYNFHNYQYYQQPGSISVKVVNNTCRNMGDYPNVPNISSLNARSYGTGASQTSTTTSLNNSRTSTSKSTTSLISLNTNAVAAHNGDSNGLNGSNGSRAYLSSPIPNARARGMSQPEANAHTQSGRVVDNYAGPSHEQGVHLGAPPQKLVMSRSKLTSPILSTVHSSTGNDANSSPLGSPLEAPTSNGHATSETNGNLPPTPSRPRQYRPSSTLSSLRSLLGNHPQGLSLIDSLEEEDYEDLESLSDTESGDSEADLIQRTESLSTADTGESAVNGSSQKKIVRKRPPPEFDWMAARRRFSASSLSTISRDINDSQKGQHALWKYIGGGNSHAPLRYDIDRILDSGCGLGEWTMEMAREFPNATVYGIDINRELFPSAQQRVPSNCLFTWSNLLTRLSFPDGYFDFVYQRFLYLGLTVDDWPVALKELKRVMKPGGWIELFEPSMRVHRAGTRTREVMQWCSRLLQEERGLDFDFAGEKMKRLCEEIGFHNVRLERLSIPLGSWGGRVGQAMAENMVLIFQNLHSALIADDSMQMPNGPAQKAFDVMVQSWMRECEENKSYIDYYILTGQRP